MTTQEVANQLVQLCAAGKFDEAEERIVEQRLRDLGYI